jgi:hypothetical protein
MAIRIPTAKIQNLQQIEALVAGPDGANRLFILTGQFDTEFFATSNGDFVQKHEIFTVLIGPVFTRQQFFKAISSASVIKSSNNVLTVAGGHQSKWEILNVDADWDDESGQVEIRIEVAVSVYGNHNIAQIYGLSFHTTILAALP